MEKLTDAEIANNKVKRNAGITLWILIGVLVTVFMIYKHAICGVPLF